MPRLWIGRVMIDTRNPTRRCSTRVEQMEEDRDALPTNALSQVGSVENGWRYLAGSFETEDRARAAVKAYTQGRL